MTCLIKSQLLSKMAHFHIHPEQTWVVVLLCYIVRCSIRDHHLQGQLLVLDYNVDIVLWEWVEAAGRRKKQELKRPLQECLHQQAQITSTQTCVRHDKFSTRKWAIYLSLFSEIALGFSEFDSLDTRRCFGEYFKEVNFYGKQPPFIYGKISN